jgi:CheY-like chemotaxis protein
MPLMGSSHDQNNEPNRAGPKSLTDPLDGTVIVLDDDQLFRTTLRITLQRAGFRTFEAEGIQELGQLVNELGHVDVLAADNVLGDGNGWEAALAIHERYPHLKLVFMSGYSAEELEEYRRAGGLAAIPEVGQVYASKATSGLDVSEAIAKVMRS